MTTNEITSADGMAARVERGRPTTVTDGKESKRNITASTFIRWAGLAAVVAGIIFAVIQPIHPPDVLSSVTTGAWAVIMPLKFAMCLLFVVGITGIYARQVKEAGWLGLAGFLLFSLNWALLAPFGFAEAFILLSFLSVAIFRSPLSTLAAILSVLVFSLVVIFRSPLSIHCLSSEAFA